MIRSWMINHLPAAIGPHRVDGSRSAPLDSLCVDSQIGKQFLINLGPSYRCPSPWSTGMTGIESRPAMASRCTALRADSIPDLSGGSPTFPVALEPAIHQIDYAIQDRMPHFHLSSRELNQLVGTLDVERAAIECAGGGSRPREFGGCSRVFFERDEFAPRSAE